jgi:hypothetical protein
MDRRMMDESRCTMPLISRQSFLDCGLRDSANEALLHHKLHDTPVKRALRSKDTRNSRATPQLETPKSVWRIAPAAARVPLELIDLGLRPPG